MQRRDRPPACRPSGRCDPSSRASDPAPHRAAGQSQAFERLGRRDLVDEVEVDEQERRLVDRIGDGCASQTRSNSVFPKLCRHPPLPAPPDRPGQLVTNSSRSTRHACARVISSQARSSSASEADQCRLPSSHRGARAHHRRPEPGAAGTAVPARALRLPTRTLDRIAGIQAQYAPSSYIGLWSRLEGFQLVDLTRALERRKVVQGTLLRSTIHLVSAGDYWPFAVGTRAARQEAWLRFDKKRLSRSDLTSAAKAVRSSLSGKVLHRDELLELARKRDPSDRRTSGTGSPPGSTSCARRRRERGSDAEPTCTPSPTSGSSLRP